MKTEAEWVEQHAKHVAEYVLRRDRRKLEFTIAWPSPDAARLMVAEVLKWLPDGAHVTCEMIWPDSVIGRLMVELRHAPDEPIFVSRTSSPAGGSPG